MALFALSTFWSGCGGTRSTATAELGGSIEQRIPSDTVILAGMNVRQVLQSPLYSRLSPEIQKPDFLQEFTKSTGLDPERDLSQVYLASNGSDALLFVEGEFRDPATLQAALTANGARQETSGSQTLYVREGHAVAFLSKDLAVAGTRQQVEKALAGPAGNGESKQAVLHQVRSLPKGSDLWVISVGGAAPMPLPRTGNLANLNRVFASLSSAVLTLNLTDPLRLTATGDSNDDKIAKQLHDTLRGLVGFARLSTPADKPEMLRLFDGIEVGLKGSTVRVEAHFPLDVVIQAFPPGGRRPL